jgi:osmoprotectant transport system ATP-binding protein
MRKKTTTLKTINRLIEPDAGKVFCGGEGHFAENRQASAQHRLRDPADRAFSQHDGGAEYSGRAKLLNYPREKWKPIVQDFLALVDMPYERLPINIVRAVGRSAAADRRAARAGGLPSHCFDG